MIIMKGLCSSRNQMVLSSLWPTSAIPHFCSQRSCRSEKLWLSSETCAFQKIRNLVFQTHPGENEVLKYRYSFYDMYAHQLDEPADRERAKESRRCSGHLAVHTGNPCWEEGARKR